MAIRLSSTIYRGHEIVVGPTGKCLVHKGDRTGPLVGDLQDNEQQAMALVDRVVREARQQVGA